MLPAEAADLFGVDTKTLARWHKARLIGARRTLGGQRRYWEDEIRARAAEHDESGAAEHSTPATEVVA